MESVNWDAAKFWVDMFQFLFTLAVAIWVAIRTGQDKNRLAIEQMDERQDELEKRLQATEAHQEHAPTHEDITQLREQTAELGSTLGEMKNTLALIHQYLMHKKD